MQNQKCEKLGCREIVKPKKKSKNWEFGKSKIGKLVTFKNRKLGNRKTEKSVNAESKNGKIENSKNRKI